MSNVTRHQVKWAIYSILLDTHMGYTETNLYFATQNVLGTISDSDFWYALDSLISDDGKVIIWHNEDDVPVYQANRSTFDGPDSWDCAN
jgi:hypothetical protein